MPPNIFWFPGEDSKIYLGSTGWKVPADEVEIYEKKILDNDLNVKSYFHLHKMLDDYGVWQDDDDFQKILDQLRWSPD